MAKKIVVTPKSEIKEDKKRTPSIHDLAALAGIPERLISGESLTLENLADIIEAQKKVNRNKQTRLRARKNLVARRMGFLSWDDFGKQFSAKLIELELEKATEQQVNGAIRFLMLKAMKAIPEGKGKTIDAELQSVSDVAPRIRKHW